MEGLDVLELLLKNSSFRVLDFSTIFHTRRNALEDVAIDQESHSNGWLPPPLSPNDIINIVLPSLSLLHVGAFLSRRMPTLNKSQTLHSVQGLLDLLIWRCLPFHKFARCICSCQGTILHNSAFDVHRGPVMSFQPRRLQLNISYHLNVQRELHSY